MKMGFKLAMRGWTYHVMALAIGLMFLSGLGSGVIALILNGALLLGVLVLALNEGAYAGEKACTIAATLEKQVKEGRKVEEKLQSQVYNKKVAAWALIICMLPMLLIASANLIAAPFFPEEEVVETEAEEESFSFNYDMDEESVESAPVNGFKVAARLVFMPYVSVYSLVSTNTLNWLFVLFSLPIPLMLAIGYLMGPSLRIKKLRDIALGKKRKMRNLKVNKKPRQQKAEV